MLIKWIAEVWHRKFFIIYICFLSVLLVFFINNFAAGKNYEYSFSYYITNSELAKLVINVDTLNEDVQMANSCKVLLESDYTLSTVGEMLVKKYGAEYLKNYFTVIEDEDGINISTEELRECVDVSIVSQGVAVLNVDIITPNSYLTRDIGEFISFLTPNVVYRVVGVSYTSPFNNARMTVNVGFMGKKAVLTLGLVLGIVLSIAILAVCRQVYGNIIMSEEDIRSCCKARLHTLGNIPYYEFNVNDT